MKANALKILKDNLQIHKFTQNKAQVLIIKITFELPHK